jgi:ankyrin repeat protein
VASTSDDLFAAIEADDIDRARAILVDEPSLATARDAQGVSALLRARYRGGRELVDVLRPHVVELDVFESAALGDLQRLTAALRQDQALVGARSGDGFSALHLAAFFGKDDAVRLLLTSGAEPDARGTGWMTGTPLHSAASGRHVEIVRALLESGADPNARQSGGWTALHAAAQSGDAELASILLAAGADPAARAEDGRSVLDMAQEAGEETTTRAIERALGS